MKKNESVLDKFLALAKDLCQNLLEREQAIEAALLALLAKEHLLLLGPPGTAKSLLSRNICERITGAVYFERLLTRFSTPEELFGPRQWLTRERAGYPRVSSCAELSNRELLARLFRDPISTDLPWPARRMPTHQQALQQRDTDCASGTCNRFDRDSTVRGRL